MPTSYRVFLGAPSMQDIANDPKDYSWRTTSSISRSNSGTGSGSSKDVSVPIVRTQSAGTTGGSGSSSYVNLGTDAGINTDRSLNANAGKSKGFQAIQPERTHSNLHPSTQTHTHTHSLWSFKQSQSFVLPKATLEEASRRISLIYRDLVVSGKEVEEEEYGEEDAEVDWGGDDEDDSLYGSQGLGEVKGSHNSRRLGPEVRRDSSGLESAIFDSRAEVSSDGEIIVPGLDASTSSRSRSKSGDVEDSVSRGAEQTTLISWPPSNSRLQGESAGEIRQTSNRGVEASSSEGEIVIPGLDPTNANTKSVEVSVFRGAEHTTHISWPPSNSRLHADETRDNSNNNSFAGPSFLLDNTTDHTRSRIGTNPNPNPNTANGTPLFTQTETQALESQSFGAYSDASSIGRFPSFHFSLHALTPLAVLVNAHSTNMARAPTKPGQQAIIAAASGWHGPGGKANANNNKSKPTSPPRKVNLLLAVLEVDGPDTIRLKKGADAGTQVSVLKMILGDEAGNVVRLTAWRETAEEWSGQVEGGGRGTEVKRGDIVHLENVNATTDPTTGTPTLTASPFLKSKLVICYRTMPSVPQDARLRPDLRLGISEPSVRRVAGVVEWFEQMAGIA